MAKRRNPKKEKALRNQAYARKFRKRSNSGRFFRRRNQVSEERDSNDNDNQDDDNNRESSNQGTRS
ncbi:MAG: hypothetical protein AAGF66_00310 [Cyanobacteria bacterium P01_H01_bin.119]|mgnify:CR=1 FL=1